MVWFPQTADERLERVLSNIRRFPVPLISEPGEPTTRKLVVCGYGPSLVDTWPEIVVAQQAGASVMTTSGAHDFLIERGCVPTYHVEIDPREHKCYFIRNSHPDVKYLLGSTCHPRMFEMLADRDVRMWHGFTDDDAKRQIVEIDRLQPGAKMICGGTNVGMRALILGPHLGYRDLHAHGFDCCYRDGEVWAGAHSGKDHYRTFIRCNGKIFETSDVMLVSARDFFNQLPVMNRNGVNVAVYGDGLLVERINMVHRFMHEAMQRPWFEVVQPVKAVA